MESLGDLTFLDKPFFAFQKFDILVQSRLVLFYDLEVRYPGFVHCRSLMIELYFFGKRFIVEQQPRKTDKIFMLTLTVTVDNSNPRQKRSHLVDILLEGERFIMSGWVAWHYRPFYTRLIRYLSGLDKCKHLRRHSFQVVRLCIREYLMTTSTAAAVIYDDELSSRAG